VSAAASALLQWWLWGSVASLVALAVAKAAGSRRADLADVVLRAAVAVQAALLAISLLSAVEDGGAMIGMTPPPAFVPGPRPSSPPANPPAVPAVLPIKEPPTISIAPVHLALEAPSPAIAAALAGWAAGVHAGFW